MLHFLHTNYPLKIYKQNTLMNKPSIKIAAPLIFVMLIIVACTDKVYINKGETETFSFIETPKEHVMADNFRKVSFLQLEINDDCIISDIKRIIPIEDRLIVLTKDSHVYSFEKATGKFITKIGDLGKGHQEYISAMDIVYNEKDKTINVIDPTTGYIYAYNVDGTFRERKAVNTAWATSAEMSAGGNLMLCNLLTGGDPPSDFAFTLIHPDGKVSHIDPFAPLKSGNYSTEFAHRPMTKCKDGIRFMKAVNDTLFTLEKGKVTPYCKVDFLYKMPSKEMVAKMGEFGQDQLLKLKISNKYFSGIDKIFESEKYISLVPKFTTNEGYYWIDKQTKEGFHISASMELTPTYLKFIEGRNIINIVGSSNAGFISSFDSFDIEAFKRIFKEEKDIIPFDSRLHSFFENADPDGNQCLVIYEH